MATDNGQLENLFYSYKDNYLFWVAGYTDNSEKVKDIVKMLTEKAELFKSRVDSDEYDVSTFEVVDSRRYKSMRVFYMRDVQPSHIPKEAFRTNKHTMMEWISNT